VIRNWNKPRKRTFEFEERDLGKGERLSRDVFEIQTFVISLSCHSLSYLFIPFFQFYFHVWSSFSLPKQHFLCRIDLQDGEYYQMEWANLHWITICHRLKSKCSLVTKFLIFTRRMFRGPQSLLLVKLNVRHDMSMSESHSILEHFMKLIKT